MEQLENSLGNVLAQARCAKAFSQADVADALSLPISTIDALEKNRFESLHGGAFVIAYLRVYAQFLHLPVQELIARYKQEHALFEVKENPLVQKASIKAQHKKYRTAYGLGVVAGLLVLLAVFGPKNNEQKAQEQSGLVFDTAIGSMHVASVEQLPSIEPTKGLLPEMASELLHDGNSQLNFQFTADCWVEVYDGDDQRIFSSLQRAEQQLRLTGKPPFRISLGYAPGVVLSYNGESVEIQNSSSTNTAQFIVGKS